MSWFPFDHWEARAAELARLFRTAPPYPHLHLVEFLDPEIARRLELEVPPAADTRWSGQRHFNAAKSVLRRRQDMPPTLNAVIDALQSPRFLDWLTQVTGVVGLQPDLTLADDGLEQFERGGFDNVHVDAIGHRDRPTWQRRCVLVVFLSTGWDESWGGALELWNREGTHRSVSYPPQGNHAVLFESTLDALHGQPHLLNCPDPATVKLLTMSYYTEQPAPVEPRPLDYRWTSQDSLARRTGIWLDNRLAHSYAWTRDRLGVPDAWSDRVLGFFARRKR